MVALCIVSFRWVEGMNVILTFDCQCIEMLGPKDSGHAGYSVSTQRVEDWMYRWKQYYNDDDLFCTLYMCDILFPPSKTQLVLVWFQLGQPQASTRLNSLTNVKMRWDLFGSRHGKGEHNGCGALLLRKICINT